eukprot:TRINITY_DN990_c0_g3_i1.p2 TRINITY_DN990_c0_g3~~TRINITY_DN990_c0_g3_i1.p2  ORF type:complete len:150 (+),score=9.36 TRINITY_DN990_c0_g3_i1:81-530(+)
MTNLLSILGNARGRGVLIKTHVPRCRYRKAYYVIRAHDEDEDDVLPIFRLPKETTAHDIEKLPRNPAVKASTIGEKLELIHKQYKLQEQGAITAMEQDLYSANWEGGEYVGKKWNIMTFILSLSFLIPILGLVFAYFTYGKLWGTVTYY